MPSFAEHLQDALGTAYKLDRELTGGGMSRVFVATDMGLDRTVVVKVLPPELAAGVNRERFRREIQLAAKLQHPHIVPLLSAGESGDLLWYTMPFIDGESLRAAIERKRELSVRDVMRILHDVIDALAYAHDRGVVHRDIKPANILTQGNHALVTDFGVAKALSAAMPTSSVTSAGIAIGTPAYMAPEQLAGDPQADHRVDVYAFGLLAYELLVGESPFTGPSPRETLAAQMSRDPAHISQVRPAVPPALAHLVMRCLAKDPAARPATAHAILDELDSMTVPISGPMTPRDGGVGARPVAASNRWRNAAIGAVVVIGAVTVAFSMLSNRDDAAARRDSTALAAGTNATAPSTTVPDTGRSAARGTAGAAGTGANRGTTIAPPATPASPPQPVILTRADSIAIAERVSKRVAAERFRDSVKKAKYQDSVQKATERAYIDSVIRANSGASAAAIEPRRLAIIEPREIKAWPEATIIGRAIADSLRRMLANQRQFILVPQDSVRAYMAPQPRLHEDIVKNLNSDLLLLVRLTALPRDSSTLMLDLYDYGAVSKYARRTASSRSGPRAETLTNLDAILLQAMAYLKEMTRGERKPKGG